MINQYELEKEAIRIAKEAEAEFLNHNMDVYEYMHQTCEGHEWVIYTYKAIQLCAECNTEDGEEQLEEIDFRPASFSDHAYKLAYATLFQACVFAFDDLPDNLCK